MGKRERNMSVNYFAFYVVKSVNERIEKETSQIVTSNIEHSEQCIGMSFEW